MLILVLFNSASSPDVRFVPGHGLFAHEQKGFLGVEVGVRCRVSYLVNDVWRVQDGAGWCAV